LTDAPTTVVWIEPSDVAPDAHRALVEWARARGVTLRAPEGEGETSAAPITVDSALVRDVESELAAAREALVQQDADAQERALARAEAIILAHPELPQAAWLRAEIERGWASRYLHLTPADPERALLAWQRANALGGARAPALTETAAATELPRVHVHVKLPAAAEVSVDGRVVRDGALELAEGPHQFRVARDGRTVRAAWISVAEGTTIDLAGDSERGACSRADFARVSRTADGIRADGVLCARWLAVQPTTRPGVIDVATCERNTCDGVLEWRASNALPSEPAFATRKRWPAWATWTLTGVGAVTVATVTIIATGAFESRPKEPRFTTGGVQVDSHR
jgi:hypothetical protein